MIQIKFLDVQIQPFTLKGKNKWITYAKIVSQNSKDDDSNITSSSLSGIKWNT